MGIYEEKNIFLEEVRNKSSKGGFSNSKTAIDKFCSFFHRYSFDEIGIYEIQNDFVDFLKEEHNLNDVAIYGLFIELKKFINFLYEKNLMFIKPEDIISKEISEKFNIAKKKNVSRKFNKEEKNLLIDYWSSKLPLPINYRNEIILKLIFYYGIKTGEISRIKISDISIENREIIINSNKTYKNRNFKLTEELSSLISYYLNCRDNNSEFLFSQDSKKKNHKKGHITERSIQRIVEKTVQDVGIFDKARATSGRYTFGAKRLAEGNLTEKVRKELGYSNRGQLNYKYFETRKMDSIDFLENFISISALSKKLNCKQHIIERFCRFKNDYNICRKIKNKWFIKEDIGLDYIKNKSANIKSK